MKYYFYSRCELSANFPDYTQEAAGLYVVTAEIALEKYFFALIFFQVVVVVFQNQQRLRKKQGESHINRKENGTNREEFPNNQGESPLQGKKRIFKCKTDVLSTRRESSVWFCGEKVFKRHSFETLRNCEFYKTPFHIGHK